MIRKTAFGILSLILSLSALLLASNPQSTRAMTDDPGSPNIVINEFVADPGTTQGNEWVELYNSGATQIDLTGWTITDGASTSLASLNSLSIGPGGYLKSDITGSKLNNPGDIIILKNASGVVIDYVAYGNWNDGNTADNAPRPLTGQSDGRCPDGSDTDADNTDFRIFDVPTPGAANVTEVCDGLDNDCDGLIDADDPSCIGTSPYYADADSDGLGDPAISVQACSAPTGYVPNSDDMCPDVPGSSPTGCIPELPVTILTSLGMLSLGGFIWFKRRQTPPKPTS